MSRLPRKDEEMPPTVRRKPVASKRTQKPERKPTARKQAVVRKAPSTNPARMSAADKAQELAQFCRDNEWWVKVETKDTVRVTAKRDDGRYKETITVEWNGNRVARNGIVYSQEGNSRTLVVHNLAAARRHISGEKLLKREVSERKRRRPTMRLRVIEGGKIEHVEGDEARRQPVIGGHIIDKWYDLVIWIDVKKRGGKIEQKVLLRTGGLSMPSCTSLIRVWERDYPGCQSATRETEGSIRSQQEREERQA